jgi:hypothetical protein
MQVLAINEDILQKIVEYKQFAEDNPRTIADIQRGVTPGDFSSLNIPIGYRVVYSVDEMQPGVFASHLSISQEGSVPHPIVVEAIVKEFGLDMTRTNCCITEEAPSVIHAIELPEELCDTSS